MLHGMLHGICTWSWELGQGAAAGIHTWSVAGGCRPHAKRKKSQPMLALVLHELFTGSSLYWKGQTHHCAHKGHATALKSWMSFYILHLGFGRFHHALPC